MVYWINSRFGSVHTVSSSSKDFSILLVVVVCVCFSAKYLCCCRLFFHFMSQSFFANLLFVQPYLKEKNEVSRIKHFFVYSHTLSSFNNSFATSVPRVQKLKETEKKTTEHNIKLNSVVLSALIHKIAYNNNQWPHRQEQLWIPKWTKRKRKSIF